MNAKMGCPPIPSDAVPMHDVHMFSLPDDVEEIAGICL
jgi:hypothetical protein